MKGMKDWLIELKNNKEFAQKFDGVKNPSEIICLARENGYILNKDEFQDLDLSNISGGKFIDVGVNIISQNASNSVVVTGNNSTAISNPIITQNANIKK